MGPAAKWSLYNFNEVFQLLNRALKQIRLFHQIKQVELARKLDISRSYLSEIESENSDKSISMDLLQKYAEVFSIPASSLLMFSENIDSVNPSDRLRLTCADKVVKVMEWMNVRDEFSNET